MRDYCDCGSCCDTCGHTNDCAVWMIRTEDAYDDYDRDAHTL